MLTQLLLLKIEELEKKLFQLPLFKLEDLLSQCKKLSELEKKEHQEKIVKIIELAEKFSKEKEASQIKQYGKKLPRILDDFFNKNDFKTLHDVADVDYENRSPLEVALLQADKDVLSALLKMDTMESFISETTKNLTFRKKIPTFIYISRNKCPLDFFIWVVNTLYKKNDKNSARILRAIFISIKSEDKWKYFIENSHLINLITWFDNGINLKDIFTEKSNVLCVGKSKIPNFDRIIPFLRQEDIKEISEADIKGLSESLQAGFTTYMSFIKGKSNRNMHSDIDEKIVKESFKKALFHIIDIISKKDQKSLERFRQNKEKYLLDALATDSFESLEFLLELEIPITTKVLKEAFFKDIKYFEFISRYHAKEMQEISESIVKEFIKSKKYISYTDILKILALPMRWQTNLLKEFAAYISAHIDNKDHANRLNAIFAQITEGKKPSVFYTDQLTIFKENKISRDLPKQIPMNDTLFAHVFNDYALNGTNLQGYPLGRSIQYICYFIDKFNSNTWKILDISNDDRKIYLEDLNHIYEKLLDCLKIEEIIHTAADNIANHCSTLESSKSENTKNASQRIFPNLNEDNIIEELTEIIYQRIKNKESFLLPAGWKGLNNARGHVMLFEIRKTKNKYELIIHNTGGGIHYHLTRVSENATYYSSIKAYEFSTDNLKNHEYELKLIIQCLLKAQIIPAFGETAYDAFLYYEEIEEMLEKAGLKETFYNHNPQWILEQISGTCAWKVFESFFRNFQYREGVNGFNIWYELKRSALCDYYQMNQAKLTEDLVHHQLNFAIQGFSRLIRTQGKRFPDFSQKRRDEGLHLVRAISQALSSVRTLQPVKYLEEFPQYIGQSKLKTEIKDRKEHSDIVTVTESDFSFHPFTFKSENRKIGSSDIQFSPRPDYSLIQFDPKERLECLRDIFKRCKNNFENAHYLPTERCITQFYLSVPLEKAAWKGLSKKELAECIDIMENLNVFHIRGKAKQSILPFVDQTIILAIGFVVVLQMIDVLLDDDNTVKLHLKSKCSKIFGQFVSQSKLPYFITTNPILNKKFHLLKEYMDIVAIESASFVTERSLVEEVIDNDKSAKTRILEICDKDKNFKFNNTPDNVKAICYYLMHRKALKNQFVQLEADLRSVYKVLKLCTEFSYAHSGRADAALAVSHDQEIMTMDCTLKFLEQYIPINKPKTGEWFFDIEQYEQFNSAYKGHYTAELEKTQPKINNLLIQKSLNELRKQSNPIQTERYEYAYIITEQVAFRRTLLTTRIDPVTQISATVDLMKKEFFRFSEDAFQNYIFINLFEFDFLDNQLVQTPDIVRDILDLIKRGLKTYSKKNQLKFPCLLFFKINVFLEKILKIIIQNENFYDFTKELKEFVTINNELYRYIVVYQNNQATEQSKTILFYLWSLYIISKDDVQELSLEDCQNILTASYFIKNYQPTALVDPFLIHKAKQAMSALEPHLIQILESCQKNGNEKFQLFLNTLALKMGADLNSKSNLKWEGSYPYYSLITSPKSKPIYTIDILSLKLYQNKMLKVPFPSELLNNPLFKEFFNDKDLPKVVDISADQTVFEFDVKGKEYRFITKPNNTNENPYGVLQCLMEAHGRIGWYQYLRRDHHTFHKHLLEFGKSLWANVDNEISSRFLIKDENTQKIILAIENNQIFELNSLTQSTGFTLLRPHNITLLESRFPFLKHFEDKSFTECWVRSEKSKVAELIIKFPRYGLEFKQSRAEDGTWGDLILMPDKKYKVVLNQCSEIIANCNNFILIEQINANPDGSKERIILFPKQQFIAIEPTPDQEYRDVILDIVGKAFFATFKNDYYLNNVDNACQSGMEQIAKYHLNNALEIESNLDEDKIFLAYIYLGSRQPLLAYKTLQKVINEDKPITAEQLEWLRRIMLEIPAKIAIKPEDRFLEEKARLYSAEVLSVRLLAGCIIVKQKQKGAIPKDLTIFRQLTADPYRRKYSAHYTQKLTNFLTNEVLCSELSEIYLRLMRQKKKIPKIMTLDPIDHHNVLRFISKYDSKLPPNVLYTKKQFTLVRYLKEKHYLDQLKASKSKQFTHQLQRRLDRINYKIDHFSQLQLRNATIQPQKVSVYPDNSFFLSSPFLQKLFRGFTINPNVKKIQLENVSTDTDELDFIYNFKEYYQKIFDLNNPQYLEQKAHLQHVLGKIINSIAIKRFKNPNQTITRLENLSLVLFYVMAYPNHFPNPSLTLDTLNVCFDIIQKLKAENKGLEITLDSAHNFENATVPIPQLSVTPFEPNLVIVPSAVLLPEIAFQKERNAFQNILNENIKMEKKDNKDIADIVTVNIQDESIKATLYREIFEDYQVGLDKNLELSAKNNAIKTLLEAFEKEDKHKIEGFQKKLEQFIDINKQRLGKLESEILILARTEPSDPDQKADWELRGIALDRPELSMEDLWNLFLSQDKNAYKEKIVLDDEKIQKLNTLLYEYLVNATLVQQHERIVKEVSKLTKGNLSHEQQHSVFCQLALLFSSERCYNPCEHPEFLLFEYLDNKLIYPDQFNYLKEFLNESPEGFNNILVQLIMGGGKSKVLLPLLALKKAKGTNLAIIEVPHALFQINKADLHLTTKQKFGKNGHDFYFDDTIDCTAEYLENCLKKFREIIVNKEYLITTKESIQSLELHFLKKLRSLDISNPEEIKKIQLLGEILRIFKYQGDVIIDEIDSTLDVRKQLIYVVAPGESQSKTELKKLSELEIFVKKLKVKLNDTDSIYKISQLIEAKRVCSAADFKIIFEKIAEQLIKDYDSPLKAILKPMLDKKSNSELEKQLIQYMLDPNLELPKEAAALPLDHQGLLALYKEELTTKYYCIKSLDGFNLSDARKKLISSIGQGKTIPKHELESVLDLYEFLKKIKVSVGDDSKNVIELNSIILAERTCSSKEWDIIFQAVAEQLIMSPESPLAEIMKKIMTDTKESNDIKDKFVRYLLDYEEEIPCEIDNLSLEEKDRIAIYKEEVSSTLGLTFRRNYKENYGLSMDPKKTGAQKEIAIPFIASNTPSERSRFGNYLETVNYTYLLQNRQSISKEIAISVVQRFKEKVEDEIKNGLLNNPGILNTPRSSNKSVLPSELEFYELTGQTLDSIELDDETSVNNFYIGVKDNLKFKRHCLLNHILNNIEKNNCYISSDAQNHASQFRSVQGMTGTDWNKRCLPPYIIPSNLVSKGSDGQTLNHLLRNPIKPHLLPITGNKPKALLKEAQKLLAEHPNKKTLHAWIDLGAFFKGIENEEVAKSFAKFFAGKNEFKHLKHVLYFGKDDKLYALPVGNLLNKDKPILLENTDPDYIQRVLDPEKRTTYPQGYFTYYDQRRTTGTDISQDSEAHAFVSLGVRTLERDLLQAVMRMRALKNGQRIEFVIPKEVQDAHPEITHWDVEAIIKFCIDNQVERLAEDHFRSALQKLKNVIRNDLYERLLDEMDVKKQKMLLKKFHKAFFTEIYKTAFQKFGGVKQKDTVANILNDTKKALLEQWKSMLINDKVSNISAIETTIEQQMREIINTSISICYKEIEKLISIGDTALDDSEVELEQEEEEENEKTKESETEYTLRSSVSPLEQNPFGKIDFDTFDIVPGNSYAGIQINSLNMVFKNAAPAKTVIGLSQGVFADNICASQNYLQTIQSQTDFTDAYKKDGLFFLAFQDDEKNTIRFLVLSPEESKHLSQELKHWKPKAGRHFWIETPHQTIQAGIKPRNLHKDYKKGIEQIAFVSADTDILYQQLDQESWLREHFAEKLKYLETVIKPIHRDKADLFELLAAKAQKEFSAPAKAVLHQYPAEISLVPRQPRVDAATDLITTDPTTTDLTSTKPTTTDLTTTNLTTTNPNSTQPHSYTPNYSNMGLMYLV